MMEVNINGFICNILKISLVVMKGIRVKIYTSLPMHSIVKCVLPPWEF